MSFPQNLDIHKLYLPLVAPDLWLDLEHNITPTVGATRHLLEPSGQAGPSADLLESSPAWVPPRGGRLQGGPLAFSLKHTAWYKHPPQ